MKKILPLLFLLIVIAIIISLKLMENNNSSKTPTATINNQAFKLELAKTQQDKEIGLSKKEVLDKNAGMLFLFEKPSNLAFWMKNMKFPIDIIFIKKNRIITIHKNIRPPKTPSENLSIYNSKEPADTVLEINAGLSEKYNFKENDLVKLDNI